MNLKYIIVGLLVFAVILGLFVSILKNSRQNQKESGENTKEQEEFINPTELLTKLKSSLGL